MISAEQMIDKVGKDKFVEMVTHSQKNGQTGAEKDRGIKGRRKFRMCEHGTWVIENYEPRHCSKCVPEVVTKPKDFRAGFNIGLGYWVESRSEEKAVAKSLGLIERG
jgi:hypothetical protein